MFIYYFFFISFFSWGWGSELHLGNKFCNEHLSHVFHAIRVYIGYLYVFWDQIGYRPFVEACVDADEKGEALKYIPKLADPRERAEVIKAFL